MTPPFTPITAPSFTVTCAEAEYPPAVAVIVAEPIDTPVIMPDVDTVARDWSELVHVTSNERGLPAISLTVALSCAVAFGTRVAVSLDNVTDAICGAVGDSFPPQASVSTPAAARNSLCRVRRRVIN